jgi:hypothetical protein
VLIGLTRSTTGDRLRDVLAPSFPETVPVLGQLREAGVIAAGTGGRDDDGAAISRRQAVLAVLALASGAAPAEALVAALALGEYRLRAMFWPIAGPSTRYNIASDLDLATYGVGLIDRAFEPDAPSLGLIVEPGKGVFTINAADPYFRRRMPALDRCAEPEAATSSAEGAEKFIVKGIDIRPHPEDLRLVNDTEFVFGTLSSLRVVDDDGALGRAKLTVPKNLQPSLAFEPLDCSVNPRTGQACVVPPDLLRAVAGLFCVPRVVRMSA